MKQQITELFNSKEVEVGLPEIGNSNKFSSSDIAFTRVETEKVIVLGLAKKRENLGDHYVDFGTEYIIRGADNKARPIYELELMTLDEACSKVEPT